MATPAMARWWLPDKASNAVALLDWLGTKGLTLDTASQGDLDAWLTSTEPLHGESGNFVRWARKHKLTRLDHDAQRWGGPTGVIDTETRWQQARWLLHDDTVDTADRVAGLLVLLYAQTAATISELTVDHIQMTDQQVMLRLGREPILVPAPLDNLMRDLVESRSGHANSLQLLVWRAKFQETSELRFYLGDGDEACCEAPATAAVCGSSLTV